MKAMLRRLPYRMQIPLGLVLAVLLSILLVSTVAAQISARVARQQIVMTVQRIAELVSAQGRALLAADDTWRAYTLLRNTAELLPGIDRALSQVAILDNEGRVLAASDPLHLPTGEQAMGARINGTLLPNSGSVGSTQTRINSDGGLVLIQPIRSEDDKVMGFALALVDAAAFAPDWAAVATPALLGAALAVLVLVPLGWLVGRRMAQPVAQTAECIAQIGHVDLVQLQQRVPVVDDPELNRIAGAVRRLLQEMAVRQANAQRALSAQRLAAVGRITAAVAHEINNPLAGLLTATRTLRLHGDTPETRLKSIDLIERGLQQIRTMVSALLPQARVDERALCDTDFHDVVTLVRATAAMSNVSVTSSIALLASPRVPSTMFRQVMLNLMLNAIKAAGSDGQVHAALSADAQTVRFAVSNTGHALTSDELEQRLIAADSNDPHGFGLWICQEFAVRFDGTFTSETASKIGAPFATQLNFCIPNRPSHDQEETAFD